MLDRLPLLLRLLVRKMLLNERIVLVGASQLPLEEAYDACTSFAFLALRIAAKLLLLVFR